MCRNCASRSGCRWPSMVLALPCRLNPSYRSRSPTVSGADPVPLEGQLRCQVAGRLRRPPQRRHRIAPLLWLDQGQQRRRSPGSSSAARLRPPPGLRARPSGPAPESSSSTPSDTVASRTPAARATESRHVPARGPRPPSAADAAAHPDAGRSPRTSPPAPARFRPWRQYHTSERYPGSIRVTFLRALNSPALGLADGYGGVADLPHPNRVIYADVPPLVR
jgi:hypothetical protein